MIDSRLRHDANDVPIMAPELSGASTQTVSLSGSSAATTSAMTKTLIMVTATTQCFIALAAAATTAGVPIYPGIPYFFTVEPGTKVAAITSGSTGSLYVTEF